VKKIIVAIPHSHTWFWTQTCIASLARNPPRAEGYEVEIVVIDNSPWSPAIRGITDTKLWEDYCKSGIGLYVIPNHKSNKFHASALDCIVENRDFHYLMALETDVLVLKPGWLQWFVDQMRDTDYAVGAWHHEQFVNPSCTIYQGGVLRNMMAWCQSNREPDLLRWGPQFCKSQLISVRQPERDYKAWYGEQIDWIAGPFAEKRGWPIGTVLKEQPSGQLKGPGWYEPGQALHHWAVEAGYTYTVCFSSTTQVDGVPVQTLYGDSRLSQPDRQMEASEMFGRAESAHLWGGTRALDIIKHDVTCEFVKRCTPGWLAREARFWRQVVPIEIQEQTLDLIRKYGWHITGQGNDHVTDRDRAAASFVKECYKAGGVTW
jgi:hypothetical protein